MNPHYRLVAQRAGHRCEYCRASEAIFNFPFEVEHAIPPNRGGSDDDSNLALSCRSCNLFKADHVDGIDPESNETTRFFNPRMDRWDEHFGVDSEAATMQGLTATGRATIERLRMNSVVQVDARRQWMKLGLFP